MEVINLKAASRSELGKTAAKSSRKTDRVPCVLYGGDEILHFTVAPLDLRPVVYTPEFKTVEIDLDGTIHRCILKDIQVHPVNERILHVDFLRLIEDHPIKIEVPISFEGAAMGLKAGGKLIKKLRKVKIKAVPASLIDKIVLDTTPMALGQTQRIKDLQIPEGIEVLNNENVPVASIEIPRALRSGTAEDATAKPAEGEAAKTEEPKAEEAKAE